MRVDGEKSEKLTDGAGLHRPSRRRARLLRRVAELGFFGRLQRNVRRNVLLMESDSDDDYDSSDERVGEDDSDDEMRPRSSAWARRVGESERDELNDMLENLASARHWAMRMGAAEKKDAAAASTRETGEEAATVSGDDEPTTSEPTTDARLPSPLITSESVSRVLYELGETGKAMFASPRRSHVAKDAGSIFVDVRWVSCLRGLFLRIKVESGAHLLAMDAGDTSDPYVKVTFVTNAGLPIKGQVHRTGYRPKTLNPVWNESFKCKTSDDVDQTIKIMIKNENRMLNDEIIGVSEISLGDCFQTGEDTIDAPVLNAKTRKRVGNIRVHCEFRLNENTVVKEVKEANEKMEAEKPKKMDTSTSGNMTISGSMDKLVEEEEKKPQYRVTKISEVVVPPGEGWF